jgi:small GTP-binding protein
MPTFDDVIKRFPPDVQDAVRIIWNALGPEEQASLRSLLSGLPVETNLMKMLVTLSTAQIRQTFGQLSRVAIVGPANVGKSTLYNQMISGKQVKAEVGPIPGTTKVNQQGESALFSVIDTPGADAVGEQGVVEHHHAISAAENADFIIILFDAIQGVKKTEQELYAELSALKKPYIVVLNKIDLISRKDLDRVLAQAAMNLGLKPEQIVPLDAKNGKNLDKVLMAVAAAEPKMIAALGKALPEYRWQLAWRSIISAASLTGAIALTPLPVIDFIPLTAAQSVMVLGIARIYNYDITLERAKELVTTFGVGFLARTLFQELSKLGGVPGWVLSAAIASSTTVVMGYAAARWFEKGEKLSAEALAKLTKEITEKQLVNLKRISKGKPDKKAIQERIAESLEGEIDIGE